MSALPDNGRQSLVKWVAKANMAYHASLKEGKWPDAFGTVDDLVRDDEVAGSDMLLERADGREGNNGADTKVAQCGNVGLVLDLVRRKLVVQAMS